jgi:hypothetical protein
LAPATVELKSGGVPAELEIRVTVDDDETTANDLKVTAESTTPDIVPSTGIHLTGSGKDRVAKLIPTGKTGKGTIKFIVTDGSGLSTDHSATIDFVAGSPIQPNGGPNQKIPVPDSPPGPLTDLLKKLPKTPAAQQAALLPERKKAIETWIAATQKAILLADDPTKQLEATRQIADLKTQLKLLVEMFPANDPDQQQKEMQCLTYITELARQYGLPSSAP